jgi:hypothetical protein
MNRISALACIALLAAAACNEAHSETSPAPAAPPVTTVAPAPATPPAPTTPDAPGSANDYVPAEFKAGAARWKDTGVYLDGQPIAFLGFGELPITLKPTWVKDKVSAPKHYGTNEPGWRWSFQRFYKFNDYLRALGIDPHQIKAIHVYGPKMSDSIVATGKDLLGPRGAGFMFRFGSMVAGKAIPQVPEGFGNGKTPDKISAVMIYVKKKPPTLIRNQGFELDGKPVSGVPYYGEPVRGGVRVYLDDRLATIIKRQDLDPKRGVTTAAGVQFGLRTYLTEHGVDISKVVEGWVIRGERRHEKLSAAELATITFTAGAQAKGVVTLGEQQLVANVIALHTRAIAATELPEVLPDEE